MSAEMLVDLATSTLAAANRVKELYVAQQSQRPVLGMTTIPTAEDIALAKQKVREAAAGMYCLVLFCLVCHYRWQEKKGKRVVYLLSFWRQRTLPYRFETFD